MIASARVFELLLELRLRSGEVWRGRLRLDLAEDVEHNNDSDVDQTDDHDRVRSEFETVDVFLKECKLVSLVALRPPLHVG